MTDLLFYDSLRMNTFQTSNGYYYADMKETNLRFYKNCPNFPYIMLSQWQNNPTSLVYSSITNQLRGRLLNTAKLKEVLNSSQMPLLFSIKSRWYLIGKGFLAYVAGNIINAGENMKLLFIACIDNSVPGKIIEISDVRFYFSREIYEDIHKSLLPALKDIMLNHTGDVILTSNLSDRVGDKIVFPRGGTLTDRANYKREVMMECMKIVC